MGGQVREGVNRKQQNCDVYLNRSATLLAAGRRRGEGPGGGGGGGGAGGVDCISASLYSLVYYLSKADSQISFLRINKVLLHCTVLSNRAY